MENIALFLLVHLKIGDTFRSIHSRACHFLFCFLFSVFRENVQNCSRHSKMQRGVTGEQARVGAIFYMTRTEYRVDIVASMDTKRMSVVCANNQPCTMEHIHTIRRKWLFWLMHTKSPVLFMYRTKRCRRLCQLHHTLYMEKERIIYATECCSEQK